MSKQEDKGIKTTTRLLVESLIDEKLEEIAQEEDEK